MAVSLVKGQKIDLNKDHPSLQYIRIGLGWDVNAFGDDEFDLDASAFLTNENNQVLKDSDFIFYNNLRAYDGGVCIRATIARVKAMAMMKKSKFNSISFPKAFTRLQSP